MTTTSNLLLGAYAMAPQDPSAAAEFYDQVAELDIAGLEFPLLDEDAATMSREWRSRHLVASWSLLVTCIPTTTGRLPTDPGYGLAATDEDARQRAVADTARAVRLAAELADESGRARVRAIQVHSAPGPTRGSGAALARSLEEIAGWDLSGARLLVEHCDADVPGQSGAKEYLTLAAEIQAVQEVGAESIGMSVNWGRSAIETRSTRGPVEHVRDIARHGLLEAIIFSGATPEETLWGAPWSDFHIPPRGSAPALTASAASLLDREAMTETLSAAGDVRSVAVKIGVRPVDLPVADRIAVATAALAETAAARAGVSIPA